MQRFWRERVQGRRRMRPRARALALAMLGVFLLGFAGSAHADRPPMAEVGFMRYGFAEESVRRMAVDSFLHRGYYFSIANGTELQVYDLKALKRIKTIPFAPVGDSFTVDEVHHRVFYRPVQAALSCDQSIIYELDSVTLAVKARNVPCAQGGAAFFVRGMSYYAPDDKLYVIGATSAETIVTQATGTNAYHESTVIRQLDAKTFALDWEIDLSDQCDTNTNIPSAPDPVVGRSEKGVISYCYVARQGRSVWIPLQDEQPVRDSEGNPAVRVDPTIGRSTTPLIDQASGRLLILEDSPPFGPAVYVFDPEHGRFYGVIPSGVSLERDGVFYDYFRGMSARSGRLYIANRSGIVMADVRADPLPKGVSYPVLRNGLNGIYTGPIAVDGGLGRLFFSYPKKGGFVVVEDAVPPPPTLDPDDPDAGTADIPEVEGKTGVTFSGAANAFGLHVVNAGGIPRLANNSDALCTSQNETINDRDEYGRCPADRAVTPGNREYFAAHATLEAGSDSGTSASSAVFRSSSSDSATDADLRAIGRCFVDRAPLEAQKTIKDACPNGLDENGNDRDPDSDAPLEPFTGGSQGRDGKGYPIRGAACTDFDTGKDQDKADNAPLGSAAALCDSTAHDASAGSTFAAAALPASGSEITVAHASSSVTSTLTSKGVETIATAVASGVDILGQVRIGRIVTTAVTAARGRAGTTTATYRVEFFNVRGPGIDCLECDPQAVAGAINEIFGAQIRARVPEPYTLASEKGYQGIVQKEQGLADSDRAVNDDDTITVNGLDLIFYNDSSPLNRDGSAGRSRVLLSLAGVEAESRYGIYLLPEAEDFEDGSDAGAGTDVLGEQYTQPDSGAPEPVSGGGDAVPVAGGPSEVIQRGFAFVRNQPGEFAMLFVLWGLFATPVYLSIRRRAMARALDR